MPAIFRLSHTFPVARPRPGAFAILSALAGALRRLARASRNRRQARLLAAMDDRMLADIGLSRSDLRDAWSGPPWRDPTEVLKGRAQERRRYRRGPSGTHRAR